LERKFSDTSHFETRARIRSVEGFTITRFVSATADKYRLLRGAAEIAGDGQDRYSLCMSLRGDIDITQHGRTQHIEPGSYAFISAADPGSLGNAKGGGDDTISFFLPRDFVDRRILNGEDICVR